MPNIYSLIYLNNIQLKNKYNLSTFTNYFNQTGGKRLKVTHNETKYYFEKKEDDNIYVLYSRDEFSNDCVIIIIDKDTNTATINNINADTPNCIKGDTKKGTQLLLITVKMLKKYKKDLDINIVVLTDNSYKLCHNKNIILSKMAILTTGNTWYGNYGFLPAEYTKDYKVKLNKDYVKIGKKNKSIMDTIKIKDIDLLKYFNKLKNFNKDQLKAIKHIIDNKGDTLLKDFIKKFLVEFDKTCKYFYYFYIDLFNDIRLKDTGSLYCLSL